jgi:hypothetical protein
MKKKLLSLFLAVTITVSGLSACSSDGKEEQSSGENINLENKDINMGRYMEKDVELPKLDDGEYVFRILLTTEKQFEVYTVNEKTQEYLCYRNNEAMKWEKSKPEWLSSENIIKNGVVTDLCLDKNGTYYVALQNYASGDGVSRVFKSEDGKTVQAIDIPILDEVQNVIGEINYYPMINHIAVLENGNLVFDDNWNSKELMIYSIEDKKTYKLSLGGVEYGSSKQFIASGNNVITSNADNNILIYNGELQNTEKTIEYNGNSSAKGYAVLEDGTLILGDSSGIHRLTSNGSLWETTVDGSLNSMSMPSRTFAAIYAVVREPEEYYAVYQDSDRGYQLKHYVFDQNVASVPEKEITVYSLNENSTIRQTISIFQAKNADVRVNYVVAMEDEVKGNVSDYIRALNTELLSGNGADILVLDGLPVRSFIEKGVLADISDVINPLEASGEIIANIASSYHEDNQIFQVPTRFGVPVLIGKEEAIDSSDSLESIIEYIEQNQNLQYTFSETYATLLKNYLALTMNELIKDNKLQEEQLKRFLENIKILADNIKATELDEYGSGTELLNSGLALFKIGTSSEEKYATSIEQINHVMDTMIPAVVIKDKQLAYSSMSQKFLPKGVVGLNSTSKEADIAKEFIQSLFSEEVQNSNLYDGLPVNLDSLKKWFAEENDNLMVGYGNEDGELTAVWPTAKEREDFLKVILEVKYPIEVNETLYNMIVENSLPYLKGDQDINQAVMAVKSKVNTYLAE